MFYRPSSSLAGFPLLRASVVPVHHGQTLVPGLVHDRGIVRTMLLGLGDKPSPERVSGYVERPELVPLRKLQVSRSHGRTPAGARHPAHTLKLGGERAARGVELIAQLYGMTGTAR